MAIAFDSAYYLKAKLAQLHSAGETDADGKAYTLDSLTAAITAAGMTPEEHYNAYGRNENLNPNAYFNQSEYLTAKLKQLNSTNEKDANGNAYTMDSLVKAIEDAGLTPEQHYEQYGAYETNADGTLVNPSNAFDANAYFQAKLAQLQKVGEMVNGKDPATMTVAELVAVVQEAGLSPVTHYAAYGAGEAGSAAIPLVQTVPVSQRVANDPARATVTGEVVPTNYNPATAAPGSAEATAKPVTKPADVGGLIQNEAVSPTPIIPTKAAPVPGDAGYMAPPPNITDTATNPVIPPSSSDSSVASGNWLVVNKATGTATVVDKDGHVKGDVKIEISTGSGGDTVTIPKAEDKPVTELPPAENVPPSVIPGEGDNVKPSTPGGEGGDSGGDTPGGGEGEGGGEGGGDPETPVTPADPTFTVTAKTGAVTFGGTATGDITVTNGDAGYAFTRQGVKASTELGLGDINDGTLKVDDANKDHLAMTAFVFNTFKGELTNGAGKIVDTALNINNTTLNALLSDTKVGVIDASDTAALTLAATAATTQVANLGKLSADDNVVVTGTEGELQTFLSADTTPATGKIDTLALSASATTMSLSSAQADKMVGAKFADTIKVTVTGIADNAAEAKALTDYTTGKIGGASVRLDADDNGWALTLAELTAANAAKILFSNTGSNDTVTITDLVKDSKIDLKALSTNDTLAAEPVNAAGDVDAAGKWHFDAGTLTYWDAVANASATIVLERATGVTLDSTTGKLNVTEVAAKTFVVTIETNSVVFGGNVTTGDITVTTNDANELVFTRGGESATKRLVASDLTTITDTSMTAGDYKFVMDEKTFGTLKGELAASSTKVVATGATSDDVTALVAGVNAIAAGGLTFEGKIAPFAAANFAAIAPKLGTGMKIDVTVAAAGTGVPTDATGAKIASLTSATNDLILSAAQYAAVKGAELKGTGAVKLDKLTITDTDTGAAFKALLTDNAVVTALQGKATSIVLDANGSSVGTFSLSAEQADWLAGGAKNVKIIAGDKLAVTDATGEVKDYSGLQANAVPAEITVSGAAAANLIVTDTVLGKLKDVTAAADGTITYKDATAGDASATFTAALAKLNISGTAKVNVTNAGAGDFTLSNKIGSFAGGSGAQVVTATAADQFTTIDLGAGDGDTLKLEGTISLTNTQALKGGDGSGDTLSAKGTVDIKAVTAANFSGFEKIEFDAGGGKLTMAAAQLAGITSLTGGSGADTLIIEGVATGSVAIDLTKLTTISLGETGANAIEVSGGAGVETVTVNKAEQFTKIELGAGADNVTLDGVVLTSGHTLKGGADTDTLTIKGTVSVATAAAKFDEFEAIKFVSTAEKGATLTMTSEQFADIKTLTGDVGTDSLVINGSTGTISLAGITTATSVESVKVVCAAGTAETITLNPLLGGVVLDGFDISSTVDKIKLADTTTATITAGAQLTDKKVYIHSGSGFDATKESDAITALTNAFKTGDPAAVKDMTTGTCYFIVEDGTKSAVYVYNANATAGISADELTLMGVVTGTLTDSNVDHSA